ncbi:hypothetical protein [Eisenibacter elegans]|jgi:hypothetical protein|uniref:hypothetical protein n=1 Tax=Eisenibacter elegans TaxID=997 RepID=UPI000419B275|nr:hypothetical protein [Eisenibacter elegans]
MSIPPITQLSFGSAWRLLFCKFIGTSPSAPSDWHLFVYLAQQTYRMLFGLGVFFLVLWLLSLLSNIPYTQFGFDFFVSILPPLCILGLCIWLANNGQKAFLAHHQALKAGQASPIFSPTKRWAVFVWQLVSMLLLLEALILFLTIVTVVLAAIIALAFASWYLLQGNFERPFWAVIQLIFGYGTLPAALLRWQATVLAYVGISITHLFGVMLALLLLLPQWILKGR